MSEPKLIDEERILIWNLLEDRITSILEFPLNEQRELLASELYRIQRKIFDGMEDYSKVIVMKKQKNDRFMRRYGFPLWSSKEMEEAMSKCSVIRPKDEKIGVSCTLLPKKCPKSIKK